MTGAPFSSEDVDFAITTKHYADGDMENHMVADDRTCVSNERPWVGYTRTSACVSFEVNFRDTWMDRIDAQINGHGKFWMKKFATESKKEEITSYPRCFWGLILSFLPLGLVVGVLLTTLFLQAVTATECS
eukprot:1630510-Amphidinium_carterae.2